MNCFWSNTVLGEERSAVRLSLAQSTVKFRGRPLLQEALWVLPTHTVTCVPVGGQEPAALHSSPGRPRGVCVCPCEHVSACAGSVTLLCVHTCSFQHHCSPCASSPAGGCSRAEGCPEEEEGAPSCPVYLQT